MSRSRLDRLIKWVGEAGALRESDTERGGLFSHSGETHGFAVGFYHGFADFKDWGGLPDGYADGKNIEDNWYPRSGYVCGAVLRTVMYLAVGAAGATYL